jgi:hypothetical protein
VEQHLAIDAARITVADDRTGTLCNAARARVAEDLELVSAALERSLSAR